MSEFLGASRGIEVLAFTDDGQSLIVGGAEPNLRRWPVDLEIGRVKIVTRDDPRAKKRTRVIRKV